MVRAIQLSFEDLLEREEYVISYSKLNTARFCPYAYYLQYIGKVDESELPMLGFVARGFFVHHRINQLFNSDGSLYNKSAEAFANSARAWWNKHICNGGKLHDREIVWNYQKQWFSFADDVEDACFNYYKRLEDEGYIDLLPKILVKEAASPIVYREKMFPFRVGGRKFKVSFDEIRRNRVIRELKVKRKPPSRKGLEENLQLTFQLLGFCSVAHDREDFRIQCGVNDELADSLGGDPYFISPEVSIQYHDLINEELYTTKRTDEDFNKLMGEVDSLDEMILREEFPPNHRACKVCQFNVLDKNRDVFCKEKKPGIETPSVYIYS